MHDYQRQFIDFAIRNQVLRFGEFTLKSGRVSPYFFNAGLFNTGAMLARLSRYYAAAISASELEFDTLFGPAYKGIPLVAATAVALSEHYRCDKPWCFNRKEAKDHGEGGVIVGAPLQGRVLIVDDVITAGTAINEAMALLAAAAAQAVGVVVALDRQEQGHTRHSAIQELEQRYAIPVIGIVCLEHIIDYLSATAEWQAELAAIKRYRQRYGI